jgi:hypothetical protein
VRLGVPGGVGGGGGPCCRVWRRCSCPQPVCAAEHVPRPGLARLTAETARCTVQLGVLAGCGVRCGGEVPAGVVRVGRGRRALTVLAEGQTLGIGGLRHGGYRTWPGMVGRLAWPLAHAAWLGPGAACYAGLNNCLGRGGTDAYYTFIVKLLARAFRGLLASAAADCRVSSLSGPLRSSPPTHQGVSFR